MNILDICPPHMSDVDTLPWEIQKTFFNSIMHKYYRLFDYLQVNRATCYDYLLMAVVVGFHCDVISCSEAYV